MIDPATNRPVPSGNSRQHADCYTCADTGRHRGQSCPDCPLEPERSTVRMVGCRDCRAPFRQRVRVQLRCRACQQAHRVRRGSRWARPLGVS